jgi:cell division protease FtsH
VRYNGNEQEVFLGHSVTQTKNISDETAKLIDEEIRKLIEDAERKARDILRKNREKLHMLAKALLEFETLSGDEVKLVLKGDKIQRDDQGGSKKPEKSSSSVPVTGRPKSGQAPGEMEPQPQS